MSIKLLALTVMLALYAAPIRADDGEAGEAGAGDAVGVVEEKKNTDDDEAAKAR